MKKSQTIKDLIKRVIRDELALNPLKSVSQIQLTLFKQGYQQVHGKLDWHFVDKLTKQVRAENLASLHAQDRSKRLAQLKERHRIITQKLTSILEGEASQSFDRPNYPSHADRIAAANTILKWDMAMFFAEEQYHASEKMGRGEEKNKIDIDLLSCYNRNQFRNHFATQEVEK